MDFSNLIALLPQVGSTGAVIVVVIVFLAHIRKDAIDRQETHALCEEKLESITNKCLDTMDNHTRAFTELKDIIRQKVA